MPPVIRVWPFRSQDPIPNPLPIDMDELEHCFSPVWIQDQKHSPLGTMQVVNAARALCETYPSADLLQEIAGDTSQRKRAQDEERYPIAGRHHLVDLVMAEDATALVDTRRREGWPVDGWPWAEVLRLLFAERFPDVWKGEEQPHFALHLWIPPESAVGILQQWASQLTTFTGGKSANFAARGTLVATNAAVEFLYSLLEQGYMEEASFFMDRIIAPREEELFALGGAEDPAWMEQIRALNNRLERARENVNVWFGDRPRAVYVAIDGGGTRTTIAWKQPFQPAARVPVGVPLTGATSRAELALRVQQIAAEVAQRTSTVPGRDAHGTVVAIGAAAGSPGELQRIKPLFKQAFEHHIPNTDLLILNDGDMMLTAERLAVEQLQAETAYPVMVLIVGTGSVMAAQRVDGTYLRLDGEEWIASDRCSATALAQRALQGALHHEQLQKRGVNHEVWETLGLHAPSTSGHNDQVQLNQELVEHYGFDSITETVNALAIQVEKAAIASAARVVSLLADEGNAAAQALVHEVAQQAARYVTAGRLWVTNDSQHPPILIVIGSLAGKCKSWQRSFVQSLGGEVPGYGTSDEPNDVFDDPAIAPVAAIGHKRSGWEAPGFRIIRPEADGATAALRVARLWANAESTVRDALGECVFVETHGGGRSPRQKTRRSGGTGGLRQRPAAQVG
jgi:N-acetylglucosamine kinase-like BadF-type ATPase